MILDLIAVGLGLIILWKVNDMSAALARLQTEVAEQTAVVESVLTLIDGLSTAIRENAEDPAALNAIADQLDENSNKLAAAVATNTPATETGESETVADADLEPIEEAPADDTGGGEGVGAGEGTTAAVGDQPIDE